MRDDSVFFTYETVKKPWGGANTFLKSLYEELTNYYNLDLQPYKKRKDKAKLVFLNQLSKGPLNKSSYLNRKEIDLIRSNSDNIVVRAVNLFSNSSYRISLRKPFLYFRQDQLSIYLANIADHVIFQSEFQKEIFVKKGYFGINNSVIYNGTSIFKKLKRDNFSTLSNYDPEKELIIASSTFSNRKNKNHDLIAEISLLPNIKINHFGSWPNNLNKNKVNLKGIVSQEVLSNAIVNSHYFLHPAINDPCPNSIIEALSLGVPVIYNPGPGSSNELVKGHGIALNINNIEESINQAKRDFLDISNLLKMEKEEYSISKTASKYASIFRNFI